MLDSEKKEREKLLSELHTRPSVAEFSALRHRLRVLEKIAFQQSSAPEEEEAWETNPALSSSTAPLAETTSIESLLTNRLQQMESQLITVRREKQEISDELNLKKKESSELNSLVEKLQNTIQR